MPAREYLVDGDQGFIGLNSRDNPLNLGKSFVSKSQNFRFDRGVAILRKGAKRITNESVETLGQIYAACTYTTSTGVEYVILVMGDKICIYNQDNESVVINISYPAGETITSSDNVDVYQAQGIGLSLIHI